jgi:hypothetical protein
VQWDLGAQGLALLVAMSLAFGAFTQLAFLGRGAWWAGVVATVGALLLGLIVSEVWFGWATEVELQPNIDGLSFDEVLVSYLIGGVIVLVARYMTRDRTREPTPA